MRQIKQTGSQIFAKIKSKKDEVAELENALEIVSEELSPINAAYKLIKANLQEKKDELKSLENQWYVINEPMPEPPSLEF